jgi:hypothetical protein
MSKPLPKKPEIPTAKELEEFDKAIAEKRPIDAALRQKCEAYREYIKIMLYG